jgi:phage baseplate assembly protein W
MSIYSKIVVPSVNKTTPVARMYRGFSTVNGSSDNFALYDFELIKQDLMNHFYTRQGERLMNPDYGTIIWDLLFEPLTEEVKGAILQNVNQIVNFDPRVQASNVLVTSYQTGIQVQVTLTYLPYNLSENLKLQFDQNNGLVV